MSWTESPSNSNGKLILHCKQRAIAWIIPLDQVDPLLTTAHRIDFYMDDAYPNAPRVVSLPTFWVILWIHVSKYSIHGVSGL